MCVYGRDRGKTRDDQMYSAVFRNAVNFQHVVYCAAGKNTSGYCLQLDVQTRVKKKTTKVEVLLISLHLHFVILLFAPPRDKSSW